MVLFKTPGPFQKLLLGPPCERQSSSDYFAHSTTTLRQWKPRTRKPVKRKVDFVYLCCDFKVSEIVSMLPEKFQAFGYNFIENIM